MPTTIKKLIEDQDTDRYAIHNYELEPNLINDNDDDDNVEMRSLNITNIDGHSLKSAENKIVKVKQPLKKSKYYLLSILILSIIGLVSLTAFIIYRTHLTNKLKQLSEKYQKQTDLINELTHFRSIDNHSIQELTHLVSSCK